VHGLADQVGGGELIEQLADEVVEPPQLGLIAAAARLDQRPEPVGQWRGDQ
jgi:hypothetical protein